MVWQWEPSDGVPITLIWSHPSYFELYCMPKFLNTWASLFTYLITAPYILFQKPIYCSWGGERERFNIIKSILPIPWHHWDVLHSGLQWQPELPTHPIEVSTLTSTNALSCNHRSWKFQIMILHFSIHAELFHVDTNSCITFYIKIIIVKFA